MASLDPGYGAISATRKGRADTMVLAAFVSAIFTSAFLLFAVQPMFTKMVLPQLGGSPGVWSVAMVFFQTLLLAGYGYAHILAKHLPMRTGAVVHLVVFGITAMALPISVSADFGEPPAQWQEFWLIGVFMASVGLPFFAVSANGPLLQAWFAKSRHPTASDPYYLYGASNLGSFAALLLYPVLIEPLMTLKIQTNAWSFGFCALGGLIAVAALLGGWSRSTAHSGSVVAEEIAPAPTRRQKLVWICLAAVPSGLLVAVTAHVSTDVAAAPLLWIVPLAIYLMTFIAVFRDPLPFDLAALERILPILAASLCLFLFIGASSIIVAMAVHFGFLAFATLVCHARLYKLRPHVSHLTTFYFCMSAGGVAGGLFCGLIAPNVFSHIAEYPILIVLTFFCLPAVYKATKRQWTRQAMPWLLGLGALYLIVTRMPTLLQGTLKDAVVYALLGLACLAMLQYRRPVISLAICAGLFPLMGPMSLSTRDEYALRSFYGVNKLQITNDGQFRNLAHGTTIHGSMKIRDLEGAPVPFRPEPLTYYSRSGPIADSIKSVQDRSGGQPRRFAVVGLGAGSMVCHGRSNDSWTFFEIDPAVVRIATNPGFFRFISACAPETRIVVGDARLTLAKEYRPFDEVVVDAFASDAIPVHLLTREAVAMYMGRIKHDGLLVLHISNRNLELESVIAAIAEDLGLEARVRIHVIPDAERKAKGYQSSHVVALSRTPQAVEPLDTMGWRPIKSRGITPWTDDYSNIVGAMWRPFQAD